MTAGKYNSQERRLRNHLQLSKISKTFGLGRSGSEFLSRIWIWQTIYDPDPSFYLGIIIRQNTSTVIRTNSSFSLGSESAKTIWILANPDPKFSGGFEPDKLLRILMLSTATNIPTLWPAVSGHLIPEPDSPRQYWGLFTIFNNKYFPSDQYISCIWAKLETWRNKLKTIQVPLIYFVCCKWNLQEK